MVDIDEEVLQDLYTWVDQIPLSRPKKNICRDFADGVMMAELIKHYFPKYLDLHNYQSASGTDQKRKNWMLLNRKAFKKLNFELSQDVIDNLSKSKPGTIERVLLLLRTKIDRDMFEKKQYSDRPEADQNPPAVNPASNTPGRAPNSRLPASRVVAPTAPVKKSGSVQNISQPDFVPRLAYEEKVQESLAKDETLEILNAKVRRLEHLLHLKDIRIDDLQARIEEARPCGVRVKK